MTASLVEWSYDAVNGEIIDVYLFPSEILDIPVAEGELFDLSCYESLVEIEVRSTMAD